LRGWTAFFDVEMLQLISPTWRASLMPLADGQRYFFASQRATAASWNVLPRRVPDQN
jgi:hypothetical protein